MTAINNREVFGAFKEFLQKSGLTPEKFAERYLPKESCGFSARDFDQFVKRKAQLKGKTDSEVLDILLKAIIGNTNRLEFLDYVAGLESTLIGGSEDQHQARTFDTLAILPSKGVQGRG